MTNHSVYAYIRSLGGLFAGSTQPPPAVAIILVYVRAQILRVFCGLTIESFFADMLFETIFAGTDIVANAVGGGMVYDK